ncbi:HAD family hydrolase [Treponema sp.]|uniref:HAD family hydrolase n=1 Tax=Treponema sp. TaxID=166 RepID=UPI003890F5C0
MKNLSSFEYLFFDLDGTLTESAPGIMNSARYALSYYGITDVPDSALRKFIGPPLMESFKDLFGFSEEKAREAMKKYREYFADKGLFENSVYEGIPETLEKLKSSGKHLYVATSKPEIYMKQILDKFDLTQYFDFAGGSDVEETRSEKAMVIEYVIRENKLERELQNGKILMIGDRKHDIIGAHKNNIPCCACLWGYGNREEFSEFKADFVIKKSSELL